jgi:glycosyltransferase involved in cell wall biosynthesis
VIPFFSIIVGFRNREVERIKLALDSLASQSLDNFELIFVDYGSEPEVAKQARRVVEAYPFAKYCYNQTQGWYWNRSHALNTGIRKASGEVLIVYDIDLIVGNDFLEKAWRLDFSRNFYTFSCFYLPEHFSVKTKNLTTDGIHYEQNYVGLCAVARHTVNAIHGFDEYFMVWGGEDDDFYKRLQRTGLQRRQMSAGEYQVFHQWHLTHAPATPGLWYLTMVNYLYSKTTDVDTNTWGIHHDTNNRQILELVSPSNFKGCNQLEFLTDQKHLFFNSLIEKFALLKAGETGYLQHEYEQNVREPKYGTFFNLNKKKSEKSSVSKKEISDFFEYFIGINRTSIADYFLRDSDNSLLFLVTKK